MTERRGSFLLLVDFERLEAWCRDVRLIFDGETPYMVGSVNTRPDFRDVDLRLILPDDEFDARFADPVKARVMNHAISTWGQRETGLPIDFQIQRMTDANEAFGGQFRNPMGDRDWSRIVPAGASYDDTAPTAPAAPGIDVERLAKALHAATRRLHANQPAIPYCNSGAGHTKDAERIAAEYARLANPEKP